MSKKKSIKQGGSKKLLLLLVLLLLAGFAATAGYFWYQLKEAKNQLSNETVTEKKKPAVPVMPIYIPLDAFTVSLMPTKDESDRVLYIGLTLRVSDVHSKELIEKFLPDIRSKLLVMFSRQSYTGLSSQEGKEQLIDLIKGEVNKPLDENQNVKVNDVLLNAFILR